MGEVNGLTPVTVSHVFGITLMCTTDMASVEGAMQALPHFYHAVDLMVSNFEEIFGTYKFYIGLF